MAVIPCGEKLDCAGSDFPITNYSAEAGEQRPSFVSLYFPESWEKFGCLAVCYSEESQNAADLCALAQEAHCENPGFCNIATTCSCEFNGSEFFYTVPDGIFCAATQAEADALAHHYACDHCGQSTTSVQLLALDACTCVDTPYSSVISFSGATPIAWQIIAGALPAGLSLNPTTGQVTGTPPDNGTYSFTVRATLASGNYGQKTFSISVLEITTALISSYTLGVAYSFQMAAAGGSGNYAWKVSAGTLPTGLTMSATGLISGTPTAAGSAAIQVQVIDTTCEAVNKSFFTPLVSTTSTSLTTRRTYKGFPSFTGDISVLYKMATYTGYMTQVAYPLGNPTQAAGAKYTYSGYDAIDIYGNITSTHTKLLTVMCNNTRPLVFTVEFQGGIAFPVPFSSARLLLGYCWPADPTSCASCNTDETTWLVDGNWAAFGQNDRPQFMMDRILNFAPNYSSTPTVMTYSGIMNSGDTALRISDGSGQAPTGFPLTQLGVLEGLWPYISITTTGDWSVTLSDPFTDQDAINSQLQYYGNGRTSENKPDYLNYEYNGLRFRQSSYTSVNFTLNCSNLVDGESYTVRYEYWRSDGVVLPQSVVFTASGTTHTINGTLLTPPVGKTYTLKNVTIGFTP